MGKTLTAAQIEGYHRDGYVFPITAMTPGEAAAFRAELERFEDRIGSRLPKAEHKYRSRSYLMFEWAQRLIRNPVVLDAVEDLIGPDILVYTATWFIKEAHTGSFAAWHQDSTYFGLTPNDRHVTAWIALSEASIDSGCMQFLPGSIRRGQLAHGTGLQASVNDAGQFIREPIEDRSAVHGVLKPGEFSLHSTLLVHQSGANISDDRRIGLGVSFIPTSVRHVGAARVPAHLVRGTDRYGHFDLDPIPTGDPEVDSATHQSSFTRWRDAYVAETARLAAE